MWRPTSPAVWPQIFATGLLIVAGGGYLASRVWLDPSPPREALSAFFGSSFAGALADSFAVSALFRRPLGLPIPHTAILPRSQARIARALGVFIATSFLEPRLLDLRVRDARLARRLGVWLCDPSRAGEVADRLGAWAAEGLKASDAIGGALRQAAEATLQPDRVASFLEAFWALPQGRRMVVGLVERSADWLADHPDALVADAAEGKQRWIPRWIDRFIVNRVANGVRSTVHRVQSNDQTSALDELVRRTVHSLRTDPETRDRVERFRTAILADDGLGAELARIVGETIMPPSELEGDGIRHVRDWLAPQLERLGRTLAEDGALAQRLDTWVRVALRRLVAPARAEIGGFVEQVVMGWSPQDMVRRIEAQVKPDLQYIRINGALVGGVAGLAIYLVTWALGA